MRVMKRFIAACAASFIASSAFAAPRHETITYEHEGTKLRGYLAWDDKNSGPRPGVLVAHEWWGLNEYAKKRADQLAAAGYVALALDMYGDGKSTSHPEEAGEMVAAVKKDEAAWLGRAEAALRALRARKQTDPERVAAIGYCFGGTTVMKLALSGADLDAVASFHGSPPTATEAQAKSVKAKMLIATGGADPMIGPDAVEALRALLEEHGVDYVLTFYGGAKHGFTARESDAAGRDGVGYSATADHRSWAQLMEFLQEAFK